MTHICAPNPLPALESLVESFLPNLVWPPVLPSLSQLLPTLPDPMFPTIRMPTLETMIACVEMQAVQVLNTVMAIIRPLLAVVGTSLEDFLPAIAGMAIGAVELLAGDAAAVYSAFEKAVEDGITWPTLPEPLFMSLLAPEIRVVLTMQHAVCDYLVTLAGLVAGLVNQACSVLELVHLPSLPQLPSAEQVFSAFASLVPGAETFEEARALVSRGVANLSEIISGISFPELPSLHLPDPLIPHIRIPDVEVSMAVIALFNALVLGPLRAIYDFCLSVLHEVGFSFPIVCVDI